ncbi:hypothetical protein TIFTF001_027109 [Ficus carica]|uniref:Uncharacterized protein n=1 Tax=Ficus carica TaxID=3494 RepID=A0AA88DMH9_FICCA|nr:hypothetical protein TIFTF001_027109 [Ficus carica]
MSILAGHSGRATTKEKHRYLGTFCAWRTEVSIFCCKRSEESSEVAEEAIVVWVEESTLCLRCREIRRPEEELVYVVAHGRLLRLSRQWVVGSCERRPQSVAHLVEGRWIFIVRPDLGRIRHPQKTVATRSLRNDFDRDSREASHLRSSLGFESKNPISTQLPHFLVTLSSRGSQPSDEFTQGKPAIRVISSSQVPTHPQINQALQHQGPVTLHILPSINVQKSLLKQNIGARDVGVMPSIVTVFDATAVFVAAANHVAADIPTSGFNENVR